jgi:hypothetical protein
MCVKVFKKLSILLDCGLPDVEIGVFLIKKFNIFGSENEFLNKHLCITFLKKIHQLVNLINSPRGKKKTKTLVVVANLTHQQVSSSDCIFQP